jgi:multiple antibiotic resistance protein
MLTPNDYIKILISLLAIIDPPGAIPMFTTLTNGLSTSDRKRVALYASIAVGIVLIVSCLIGKQILQLFGISIMSFRIGGGILLLLMGIAMMHARQSGTRHTPEEDREAEEKEHIAIVPLAIPLLAGPGAISTMIIYSQEAHGLFDWAFLIGSSVIAAISIWITFLLSIPISRWLGTTGINVAKRIMGLILTAVAVEFIAKGLLELFPGLAH